MRIAQPVALVKKRIHSGFFTLIQATTPKKPAGFFGVNEKKQPPFGGCIKSLEGRRWETWKPGADVVGTLGVTLVIPAAASILLSVESGLRGPRVGEGAIFVTFFGLGERARKLFTAGYVCR
jgi:hypothetical protein